MELRGKGEGASAAKKVVGGAELGALHHDDGEKYGRLLQRRPT